MSRRAVCEEGNGTAQSQNVPDCLSRDPMTVLHPGSITLEPMKRGLFPKDGAAHAGGVVRKVFRFDANPLFDLAIRGGERAELATEFPRVTVQVSGQNVRR
jgi:hypothetical protein